nr:carboxypeptidase-like regulatory domain-containing protein [Clostridia bacterium]
MKGYTNGKRWLALFLSLALILTMLPLGALRVFAESGDEEIYREICMYDDDHFCMLYESKPGSSSSGSSFLDGVTYDKDTNTVHLDNVDTAGADVSLSCVNMGEDFRIDVSGDNFLNAIWCDGMEGVNCSLTIDGNGSLMLYHGIVVNGSKSSETTLTIGDGVWFSVGEGGLFVEQTLAEYDGLTIEGQLAEGAVVKEMAQKQPYSETITNDSGYLHLDIYRSVDPGDTTWYGCFHIFSSGSPTGQYFNMYRLTGEPGSFTDYERINSESYTVEAEMLLSYMPYTEEPDSWNYYIGADGEELDSVDIFPTGAEVLRRPRITTSQLPDGTVGVEYFFQLEAKANSGGEIRGFNPYDSMPAGLKIDQDNGQIYGTPEKAGIYTLRFVTNEYKEPSLIQSHPKTLQLIVNDPIQTITVGEDFPQYGSWTLKVTKSGEEEPAINRYVRYGALSEGDVLYTGKLAPGKYTAELCVRAENGIYTYTQVFDATASRDTIPLTQQNESFVPAKACGTFKVNNFDELPQPQNYFLNITTYDEDGNVLASAFSKATAEVVNLKNILPEGAAVCEAEFHFSDAQRNTVTLLKQTLLPDEIRAGIVSLYVDSYLAQTYGPYKLQIEPAALNGCASLGYGNTYLSGVSDDAESLYFYLAPEVFEDGGDALFSARVTRWPEDLLDTWDMNRWNGPAVDRYEKTFSVEFERLTKNDAVFGTVTDGTDPIPFATVTATQVINSRSFSVSTVSGADGSYRIDELTNVPTSIFAT